MHAPNQYYSVVVTDLLHDRLMLMFFPEMFILRLIHFLFQKQPMVGYYVRLAIW